MKKLMVAAMTATAFAAFADEPKAENKAPVEAEQAESAPLIWGFGSTGIYSGYQLYGSLLNSEPTWQTYAEGNINLPWDIGSVGVGVWFNNDLTDKRRGLYGKAFNEYDPNVHFDRTFWFDDDKTWGLAYRTEVVWYIYPHHRGHHFWTQWQMGRRGHFQSSVSTFTTMDWNHYFELKNPYVTPYFKWVHEYHENKANLWLAGLKKTIGITDDISITPTFETVYRSHRYNWCFPTAGWDDATHGSGFASQRIGFDLNWQLAANFGVFAKLYYCHIYDHSLRSAADRGFGNDYGQYKDFAWGGVGVTWNF
jgi:hypothetical protein